MVIWWAFYAKNMTKCSHEIQEMHIFFCWRDCELNIKTLSDSDKNLLEKTKRILSSLGSYLKMELTNVDHEMRVIFKH